MSDGYADRMERIMQTALDRMGQVATTRSRPVEPTQTVVTSSGPGMRPVVINPPGMQGAACKHCGASIETGTSFCADCGKPQQA